MEAMVASMEAGLNAQEVEENVVMEEEAVMEEDMCFPCELPLR